MKKFSAELKKKDTRKKIYEIVEEVKSNRLKLQATNTEPNPSLNEPLVDLRDVKSINNNSLENLQKASELGERSNHGPYKSTDNRLYDRYLENQRKVGEKIGVFEADSDIIDTNFIAEDLLPPM